MLIRVSFVSYLESLTVLDALFRQYAQDLTCSYWGWRPLY